MEKHEIASYLANLSTLMQHQDRAGGNLMSQTLGREYNRYWDELKQIILDEEEAERKANETRQSES